MRGKLDTYRQPNRIILRRTSSFRSIRVNLVYRREVTSVYFLSFFIKFFIISWLGQVVETFGNS